MKRLRLAGILAALLLSPILASATDINVFPTGPIYKITPALVWGTSTNPGFNNNYFFTPININESVCVFVYNNNPTNSHQFSASISITGDPSSIGPSTGTWQLATFSNSFTAAISPGLPSGLGASVTGAAQVSVNFSASSTAGGSPDTANVIVVQTSGNCFAGNQFIGSAPQTVSAVPPVMAISDGLSQSFFASAGATNPSGTTADIINIFLPILQTKQLYFDKLVITTSSTTDVIFNINTITSPGTTCSTGGIQNQKLVTGSPSSLAGYTFNCTGTPTVSTTIVGNVIAGQEYVLDLKGFIVPTTGGFGIDVLTTGSVTGSFTAFFSWYEK